MISREKGAFRIFRTRNAAGNRRTNLGVVEIDLCRKNRSFARLHCRLGRLELSLRSIVRLLGNSIDLHELAGAFGISLRLYEGRARLSERCFGSLQLRVINGRINLVELFALFNFLTFLKETFLENAVYLRTHLGNVIRTGAARQNRINAHCLRLHCDHHHFRRRPRLPLSGLSLTDQAFMMEICQQESRSKGCANGDMYRFSCKQHSQSNLIDISI